MYSPVKFCTTLSFCLSLLHSELCSGNKIPDNSLSSIGGIYQIEKNNDFDLQQHEKVRHKRELEMMDNEGLDYPVSENQEDATDEGFWDRVIKVALKMFNRFVQWLNSSE